MSAKNWSRRQCPPRSTSREIILSIKEFMHISSPDFFESNTGGDEESSPEYITADSGLVGGGSRTPKFGLFVHCVMHISSAEIQLASKLVC
jgi:hypothetical protein